MQGDARVLRATSRQSARPAVVLVVPGHDPPPPAFSSRGLLFECRRPPGARPSRSWRAHEQAGKAEQAAREQAELAEQAEKELALHRYSTEVQQRPLTATSSCRHEQPKLAGPVANRPGPSVVRDEEALSRRRLCADGAGGAPAVNPPLFFHSLLKTAAGLSMPPTVRGLPPDHAGSLARQLARARVAVRDSSKNHATRIAASMTAWSSASTKCELPVPVGPVTARFSARPTHSRVSKVAWVAARIEVEAQHLPRMAGGHTPDGCRLSV